MNDQKSSSAPDEGKKPYRSPQLHVYGSLPQIVGSVMGTTGNDGASATAMWHNTM